MILFNFDTIAEADKLVDVKIESDEIDKIAEIGDVGL